MSIIGVALNLLLAALLMAALGMGWRLNRRLKALRDSHDGFAVAVRELNGAAARAEQGLSDLRAATDEAVDLLADRIDKGRALAAKLERLIDHAGVPQRAQPAPTADPVAERRLGALLAAAREARPERERYVHSERFAQTERLRAAERPQRATPPLRRSVEEDLFDDEPLTLDDVRGARR
jgi:ParB-like chromosome segregation protein Spo0J